MERSIATDCTPSRRGAVRFGGALWPFMQRGHDNGLLRAVDDRLHLVLLGLGHGELVERLLQVVHEGAPLVLGDHQIPMGIAHGAARILLWPPEAQPTISVTRYLNPGGETRWCASSTRGFAFKRGSPMTRSIKSSTTVAIL